MPDTTYLITVVVVSSAITWALRAVPFAALAPLRHSDLLPYLAERMPVGVMAILTIYTLRHTDVTVISSVIPTAIGIAVTTGMHLWRNNLVVSLLVGTTVYVTLASTLSR